MKEQEIAQQTFENLVNIIENRKKQSDKLKEQLRCDEVYWVITSPIYFARNGNLWGVVSRSGEWLVPCEMDGFFNCPEQIQEVIPLKKDGKWGFYTLDGIFVIPQFDEFTDEGDDIVSVKFGDQWGWLDDEGLFITKEEAEKRDIIPLSWWCQSLHPRHEDIN